MPINITQSQKIQLDNGFVGSTGSFNFSEVTVKEINALLIERAEIFKDEWIEQLNSKKIIASGNIENVDYEIEQTNSSATLNIRFPYYAKFQDEGVMGYVSKSPNSRFKFKDTYSMSKEGRESIKKWLSNAKAKVRSKDVKKYGAVGTERKFKKISETDQRLKDVIYNIKAFGIKPRNFIDPVLNKTLVGFEKELGEAIGKTITINIFK
jgi:uncharacterized protein YlzI (FlbEa/FlbD family)